MFKGTAGRQLSGSCTLILAEALHAHAFTLDGRHNFSYFSVGYPAVKTEICCSEASLFQAGHRGELYDYGVPRMHRGRPSVVGKHGPRAPPHCLLSRRVRGQLLPRRTGLPAAVPAGAPPPPAQPFDRFQMATKGRQQLSFASCSTCAERSMAMCPLLKNAQKFNVRQKRYGAGDSQSWFERVQSCVRAGAGQHRFTVSVLRTARP